MHQSTFFRSVLTTTSLLTTTLSAPTAPPTTNKTSKYILKDNLSASNFFPSFDFYTGPDPTHGFVQYLNSSAASAASLIGVYNDTGSIYIGVDHTSKDPKGRASVRLESKKSWNKGLLIADIAHMPASQCGVWGAYWMLSSSKEWPEGGEIDIIEGVNDQVRNAVTLHTAEGCVVDNSTSPAGPSSGLGKTDSTGGKGEGIFTGTPTTQNCDVNALGQSKNVGCSIAAPEYNTDVQLGGSLNVNTRIPLNSFGTPFNDAEGGVYAMEWTSTSISVWFIPRYCPLYDTHFSPSSSSSSPNTNSTASIPSPLNTPNPSLWGTPQAHFSSPSCDIEKRFSDLKIIFNIDFCGDWAGREWAKGGCKKKTGVETCEAYVLDNPGVFEEAYWEVGRLEMWQME